MSRPPAPEEFLWPAVPWEDWHPCFPRHTVRVRLYAPHLPPSGRHAAPCWHVTIYGADDLGFEAVFTSEADARRVLADLPNPLPKAWLLARGFGYA